MNLLQETIDALKLNGKTAEDVLWVSCYGRERISFGWTEFSFLADENYNEGFGMTEVNTTLQIVGKDWWLEREEYDGSGWLEREEYDGSEEWTFCKFPVIYGYKNPSKEDIFPED